MNKQRIAAFFDFDKTLLTVESAKIGIKSLWDNGGISIGFILHVLMANFFYKKDLYSDERMARLLLTIFKGKSPEEFAIDNTLEYYNQIIKPYLAPNLLIKLEDHRKAGHLLILLSAGVRHMLEPVVLDLGFHHLLCTELEIGTDGLFTGKADGMICIGDSKRYLANRLAKKVGIDLGGSYAYGNHHSDIPMLKAVGHPLAVEPTSKLRKMALDKGWPIIRFN